MRVKPNQKSTDSSIVSVPVDPGSLFKLRELKRPSRDSAGACPCFCPSLSKVSKPGPTKQDEKSRPGTRPLAGRSDGAMRGSTIRRTWHEMPAQFPYSMPPHSPAAFLLRQQRLRWRCKAGFWGVHSVPSRTAKWKSRFGRRGLQTPPGVVITSPLLNQARSQLPHCRTR